MSRSWLYIRMHTNTHMYCVFVRAFLSFIFWSESAYRRFFICVGCHIIIDFWQYFCPVYSLIFITLLCFCPFDFSYCAISIRLWIHNANFIRRLEAFPLTKYIHKHLLLYAHTHSHIHANGKNREWKSKNEFETETLPYICGVKPFFYIID